MNGTPQVESGRTSDWLLFENTDIGRYSRENGTVAASQTLKDGQMIGFNDAGTELVAYDAGTELVAYDDAAPNGAVAVGILVGDCTTGVGETKDVVYVTRHARINANSLYTTGLAAPAIAAGLADLASRGIVTVREV